MVSTICFDRDRFALKFTKVINTGTRILNIGINSAASLLIAFL